MKVFFNDSKYVVISIAQSADNKSIKIDDTNYYSKSYAKSKIVPLIGLFNHQIKVGVQLLIDKNKCQTGHFSLPQGTIYYEANNCQNTYKTTVSLRVKCKSLVTLTCPDSGRNKKFALLEII